MSRLQKKKKKKIYQLHWNMILIFKRYLFRLPASEEVKSLYLELFVFKTLLGIDFFIYLFIYFFCFVFCVCVCFCFLCLFVFFCLFFVFVFCFCFCFCFGFFYCIFFSLDKSYQIHWIEPTTTPVEPCKPYSRNLIYIHFE